MFAAYLGFVIVVMIHGGKVRSGLETSLGYLYPGVGQE